MRTLLSEGCFGRLPAHCPLQWSPGRTSSGLPGRWGEDGEQQVKIPQLSVLTAFLNAPQAAASLWLISRILMKQILIISTRVLIPFNGIFWGPCSAIFTDIIFPVFTGMFAWSYLEYLHQGRYKFGSQSFHPCYLICLKSRADFIFTPVKGPC